MVKTEDDVGRSSRPPVSAVDDGEVRALLMRYQCPVPFHAVRTRFLGNIASPMMSASPLDSVKALWGGEFPEFNGLDALNELLGVLVMGLWNRLARHQERNTPFRLMRVDVPATREGLAEIALIRRDELDGFVQGLFGTAESLELPERAHRAINALSELRAIFDGLHELAASRCRRSLIALPSGGSAGSASTTMSSSRVISTASPTALPVARSRFG
jgi:hypothetical protein